MVVWDRGDGGGEWGVIANRNVFLFGVMKMY